MRHYQRYQKGTQILYTSSDRAAEEATILGVHLDDLLEPYYTILLEDGREKQTDHAHLSMLTNGGDCDSQSTASLVSISYPMQQRDDGGNDHDEDDEYRDNQPPLYMLTPLPNAKPMPPSILRPSSYGPNPHSTPPQTSDDGDTLNASTTPHSSTQSDNVIRRLMHRYVITPCYAMKESLLSQSHHIQTQSDIAVVTPKDCSRGSNNNLIQSVSTDGTRRGKRDRVITVTPRCKEETFAGAGENTNTKKRLRDEFDGAVCNRIGKRRNSMLTNGKGNALDSSSILLRSKKRRRRYDALEEFTRLFEPPRKRARRSDESESSVDDTKLKHAASIHTISHPMRKRYSMRQYLPMSRLLPTVAKRPWRSVSNVNTTSYRQLIDQERSRRIMIDCQSFINSKASVTRSPGGTREDLYSAARTFEEERMLCNYSDPSDRKNPMQLLGKVKLASKHCNGQVGRSRRSSLNEQYKVPSSRIVQCVQGMGDPTPVAVVDDGSELSKDSIRDEDSIKKRISTSTKACSTEYSSGNNVTGDDQHDPSPFDCITSKSRNPQRLSEDSTTNADKRDSLTEPISRHAEVKSVVPMPTFASYPTSWVDRRCIPLDDAASSDNDEITNVPFMDDLPFTFPSTKDSATCEYEPAEFLHEHERENVGTTSSRDILATVAKGISYLASALRTAEAIDETASVVISSTHVSPLMSVAPSDRDRSHHKSRQRDPLFSFPTAVTPQIDLRSCADDTSKTTPSTISRQCLGKVKNPTFLHCLPSSWDIVFSMKPGEWRCTSCSTKNPVEAMTCDYCTVVKRNTSRQSTPTAGVEEPALTYANVSTSTIIRRKPGAVKRSPGTDELDHIVSIVSPSGGKRCRGEEGDNAVSPERETQSAQNDSTKNCHSNDDEQYSKLCIKTTRSPPISRDADEFAMDISPAKELRDSMDGVEVFPSSP